MADDPLQAALAAELERRLAETGSPVEPLAPDDLEDDFERPAQPEPALAYRIEIAGAPCALVAWLLDGNDAYDDYAAAAVSFRDAGEAAGHELWLDGAIVVVEALCAPGEPDAPSAPALQRFADGVLDARAQQRLGAAAHA